MELYGNEMTADPEASVSVQREIIGFFKDHPFLLVSEGRLACLLCRPPDMVCEAVRSLEEEGLLLRKDGETLLGVADNLERVEI